MHQRFPGIVVCVQQLLPTLKTRNSRLLYFRELATPKILTRTAFEDFRVT